MQIEWEPDRGETAQCLKEQLRKLAISYFDDNEVRALLRSP